MTDYHGAETALVDLWIDETLKAYTPLTDIVGQRIFSDLAPSGSVFPYVIYQVQSPPSVVRGVGLAEVMVDTIYTVKAINQSPSYAALAPAASAIRSAMVTADTQAPTGGLIFTCGYERQVAYTEGRGTEQARHLGGEFRIQAQAT